MSQTPDSHAQFFFLQGLLYKEVGEYQAALTNFDQALAIQPHFYEAWYYRGLVLGLECRYLNRQEEALDSLQKAIECKPDDYLAWYKRGEVELEVLEDYEASLLSFDQALKLKSDDYYTWWDRSFALYQLERYDEALASYQQL
ncbi:MAG: tetratricopeptide repeat protein [Symploca sp. SIO1A3]|nr:tetratricopeptide repeat protein [Symploca sp. SIO1A3]